MNPTIEPPAGGHAVATGIEAAIWEMTRRAEMLATLAFQRRQSAVAHRAQGTEDERISALCVDLEEVYRDTARRLSGLPSLPSLPAPTEVRGLQGGLGMLIGGSLFGPPPNASLEEIRAYQELMHAVNEGSLTQAVRAASLIKQQQPVLQTRELDPEDLPQPDPLTASPAEETGSHAVVPPQQEAAQPPLPKRVPGATRRQNGAYVRRPVDVSALEPAARRELTQRVSDGLEAMDGDSSGAGASERARFDEQFEERAAGWTEAFTREHGERFTQASEQSAPTEQDGDA